MDRNWNASTPAGLRAILERPRVNLSRVCKAVEQYLTTNRDNLRDFFEQCFPVLLKRLFGYDGSSWLSIRDGKDQDMAALLELLNPRGPLFQAMRGADVDGATRFLFPRERLPTHTQMLLGTSAGRAELLRWPQYTSGLVTDGAGRLSIQMTVTQYFLAWFAFYVFRGGEADTRVYGGGRPDMLQSSGAHERLLPESMKKVVTDAFHLPLLHHHGPGSNGVVHDAYLSLFICFLREFFPQNGAALTGAAVFGPSSSSLVTKSSTPSSILAARTDSLPSDRVLSQLFLSTLVEFWLTDGEEPLPGQIHSTSGLDLALWNPGYEPPSEEALAAIQVLCSYVALRFPQEMGGAPWPLHPAQGSTPWLPVCPIQTASPAAAARAAAVLNGPARLGASASPGPQALARRVYRFLLRAVCGWSSTRSTRSLALTLCAVLWPWRTPALLESLGVGAGQQRSTTHHHHLTDFLPSNLRPGSPSPSLRIAPSGKPDISQDGPSAQRPKSSLEFTEEWESHVLAHLPFYTTLIPLFLEFAAGWAEARPQETAEAVRLVLEPLASSASLHAVLESAERAEAGYLARQQMYHQVGTGTMPRGVEERTGTAHHHASARGSNATGFKASPSSTVYADIAPWLADRAADWAEAASVRCYDSAAAAPRSVPVSACSLFLPRGDAAASSAAIAARTVASIGDQTLPLDAANALHSCLEAVFGRSVDDKGPHGGPNAGQGEQKTQTAADDGWARLPKSSWHDARIKGDTLLCPVGSYEIAWLVRILVSLSLTINRRLGLGSTATAPGQQQQPPETRWEELIAAAVRRGRRVNLRPLADVRNLGWSPVILLFVYWSCWGVLAALRAGWQALLTRQ